jgi:hypothetical protein
MRDRIESRRTLFERLTTAQLHVFQATAHVNRQRKLVSLLEKDGPARLLPEATKLLRHLENALALLIEDRDRLSAELVAREGVQSKE